MNPDNVILDPDEIEVTRRVIYTRWMNGALSFADWDALSYRAQCEIMEVKRAVDENTKFDHKVRR